MNGAYRRHVWSCDHALIIVRYIRHHFECESPLFQAPQARWPKFATQTP